MAVVLRAEPAGTEPPAIAIKTLADLPRTEGEPPLAVHPLDLRCMVWYADVHASLVIVQDDFGTEALSLDQGETRLRPGDRLWIHGRGTVARSGPGWEILRPRVVDNDGLHASEEKSGAIRLAAGWTPLRLDWFNAGGPGVLALEYEGPGISRRPIAATDLRPGDFPTMTVATPSRSSPGLAYTSFRGRWWKLPANFDADMLLGRGVTPRIDPSVATRAELVALQFTGLFHVARDGVYSFYLSADDGSRLFLGNPSLQVEVVGQTDFPPPQHMISGQNLAGDARYRWAAMEGRIKSVALPPTGLLLEIQAGAGRTHIAMPQGEPWLATLLPNARVRITGVCQADLSPDQVMVATTLLAQTPDQIEVLEAAPETWRDTPLLTIEECLTRIRSGDGSGKLVRLRGSVAEIGAHSFTLRDQSGSLRVQGTPGSEVTVGASVDVLGGGLSASPDPHISLSCIQAVPRTGQSTWTIGQIHQMNGTDLARGVPVKIAGVVTCSLPERRGVILQDATRAIYVDLNTCALSAQAGDFLDVRGIAKPGEFSPFVQGTEAHRLGTGRLPDPIFATREQLIDGSLHCQYVEIEGYVADVQGDRVTLLMRSGRVKLRLEDSPAEALRRALHSIVRIRACLFSSWDKSTHSIQVGTITLDNTSIMVDHPPAPDSFAAPRKRAAELLQFDPRGNFFQRICVAGQVLHADGSMLYLDDHGEGVRSELAGETGFLPGDLVEISGFARFEGPTPTLTEAVARKTGHAPLPAPLVLAAPHLLHDRFDTKLVSLRAVLIGFSLDDGIRSLELEAGTTRFHARLHPEPDGAALPRSGSTVELTGVYLGRGGNRAIGRPIESFDLLLNSSADVRLLANPPWWTLQRLLAFLGVLVFGLAAALTWVRSLHRQVAEQTQRLEREIGERQQVEQQRVLEQERSRLAHDLHDDLGAGLTEVGMLGALAGSALLPAETRARHLHQLTEISRRLVDGLDEIVWAVNPKYDSVSSLPAYFSSYVQRFLELAAIRCRLDIAYQLPETALGSNVRHGLFLALKEALNNVVRHANATEVTLRIGIAEHDLFVSVTDNGCGVDAAKLSPGMEGLANMRQRLQAFGGSAEISSPPEGGTTVILKIPLL